VGNLKKIFVLRECQHCCERSKRIKKRKVEEKQKRKQKEENNEKDKKKRREGKLKKEVEDFI
jgi:hypothetical protein